MVNVISDTSFLIHLATHRIKNIDSIETDIGPLSFIVPKIVKKELEHLTSDPDKKIISKFEFLSPSNNHRGGVALDTLDVDKSFEGKVMFFRSDQMHTVYPFYTTDDYRITVSGNLFYN